MGSSFHFCLLFLLLRLKYVSSCLDDQCREMKFPGSLLLEGKRLMKHVISAINVMDRDFCELQCYLENNCVSINFEVKLSTSGTHNCDLNNSTHQEHEIDLLKTPGYVYHGTNNACGKAPCKNNATCQSGFTSKRYRCLCIPGFTGQHCEHDVDECSASVSVCDVNANCQNNDGSYVCSCKPGFTGDGKTCTVSVNTDCAQVYKSGERNSRVYTIDPDGSGTFDVFCDQTTAGGGCTVFQKRQDGSEDFYLDWANYTRGFGNLTGEFWLGLDKIHRLTNSSKYKLRVDLEDMAGNTAYAEYDLFAVGSEGTKYQLSLGSYNGTAGDSLAYHNGSPFTTKDQDNDSAGGENCAVSHKGAWWYYHCYHSNLNGVYHNGQYSGVDGIRWNGFSIYSAKRAEMKIRPVDF